MSPEEIVNLSEKEIFALLDAGEITKEEVTDILIFQDEVHDVFWGADMRGKNKIEKSLKQAIEIERMAAEVVGSARENPEKLVAAINAYKKALENRMEAEKKVFEYQEARKPMAVYGLKPFFEQWRLVGEVLKAERERDEWAAMCARYKKERDEARRDCKNALKELSKISRNNSNRKIKQKINK